MQSGLDNMNCSLIMQVCSCCQSLTGRVANVTHRAPKRIISSEKFNFFLGRGQVPSQTPPLLGRGTPLPKPHPLTAPSRKLLWIRLLAGKRTKHSFDSFGGSNYCYVNCRSEMLFTDSCVLKLTCMVNVINYLFPIWMVGNLMAL
jgi:hypothetical protein